MHFWCTYAYCWIVCFRVRLNANNPQWRRGGGSVARRLRVKCPLIQQLRACDIAHAYALRRRDIARIAASGMAWRHQSLLSSATYGDVNSAQSGSDPPTELAPVAAFNAIYLASHDNIRLKCAALRCPIERGDFCLSAGSVLQIRGTLGKYIQHCMVRQIPLHQN